LSGRFQESAEHHVREILGPDGRVSVNLTINGESFSLSRRSKDDEPEGEAQAVPRPMVLAQTEIEELGVDPMGRLRLIDGFRSDSQRKADRERAIVSEIDSLSVALADLRREIASRSEEVETLQSAQTELAVAESRAAETRQDATVAAGDIEQLDLLGQKIARGQVRVSVFERSVTSVTTWREELGAVLRAAPAIERLEKAGEPLDNLRAAVSRSGEILEEAMEEISSEVASLEVRLQDERRQVTELEDQARVLRRNVDALTAGAGAATRELAAIRERVAQLEALSQLIADQETRHTEVLRIREAALDLLDETRAARHAERQEIAQQLNHALNPQISIEVRASGLWKDYAEAITDCLKGSGLHYSDLADPLADALSPRALARAVENDDAKSIAECAGIPEDRALRVIDRLREVGLSSILTASVEDYVEIALLSGGGYKPSEQLSMGQRCTAVLPILLQHQERPVVLDQPEDHLDGAFIVDTLVKGIHTRNSGSQLIVATHNANIPVLGDAAQVTVLGSNGQRGYETHTGPLSDPKIVDAITAVMEGGREAFVRRAAFYGDA
jgi:hypothetical protein